LKKQVYFLFTAFIFSINISLGQNNISISQNLFTEQELITDVLFGTNCVDNIIVNNSVSGNFSNGDLSFGYFNANNSGFPFSEGLVLSTGRLSNVPGPNNTLSDDDAPNWLGDQDLENALGINNTINATIIEFSFVPQANNISFRYLFASEEYRENEPTTCQFSDAFAFLIRPVGGQYENLALVPGTNTPVQVTTVRPEIPGACDALNEEFFGQFNGLVSPINFNGQTTILTAESDVISGQTYEIKLVIADETNFRFDSAVFIEANSFNIGVDLGQDQTLCDGEVINLEIENDDALAIRWFVDGQQVVTDQNNIPVSQNDFGSGLYRVEVDLPSGCTAEDEVEIIYNQIITPENLTIATCTDQNGFGVYNLFDISSSIDSNLQILDFYFSENDAALGINQINSPQSFFNDEIDQIIFFEVIDPSNCRAIFQVQLEPQTQIFEPFRVSVCPSNETSPTTFPPSQLIKSDIAELYQIESSGIDFYPTETDAINQSNEIPNGLFEFETDLLPLTLVARLNENSSCIGLLPVIFQRTPAPIFTNDETEFSICENEANTLQLSGEIEGDFDQVFYDWDTGETSENIVVNEAGTYRLDVTSVQTIDGQELVCTNFKIFNVVGSSAPEVSFTQTGFVGIENRLVIDAEGSGDYEYAFNNSNFVDDNTFLVTQTENTFSVRDKNGCGEVSIDFVALRIPGFFTPNGDGINDYWQIEGIRQNENSVKTIYIFDRYGKLLFESSPLQVGWDGNFKGIPMPTNDYWYKIVLNSGQSLTGHLTLKRGI